MYDPRIHEMAECLVRSYQHWTGESLLPCPTAPQDLPAALDRLQAVVLAHGVGPDPTFCYGNQAALSLFEMDWNAFTTLPSRLSAEPGAQEERARLLAEVRKRGYTRSYSGVRIAASGLRFLIRNVTVWNLLTPHGVRCGQAACFAEWEYLDPLGQCIAL